MITKPNCFVLDSNSTYFREYDSKTLPANAQATSDVEFPVANFDHFTVFYDAIFLEGHQKIIITGPPLLNLKERFLCFDLCLETPNGTKKLKPTRTFTGSHVFIWEFATSNDVVNEGRIHFEHGQKERINIRTIKQQKRKITLTTLQKDNPVQWIIDWVDFHNRIGVDQFIIYDNGSSYQNTLEEQILKALPNIHIEVIAWNFPYGPAHHGKMKFCQVGQLNHCLTSNPDSEWVLNLDIDENLILGSAYKKAADILDNIEPTIGAIYIPGRIVINTHEKSRTLELTVRDFGYVSRQPQKYANKFIVKTDAAKALHIHDVKIGKNYEALCLPLKDLCFFHYKSLTTDWKRDLAPGRRNQQKVNQIFHEPITIVKSILDGKP